MYVDLGFTFHQYADVNHNLISRPSNRVHAIVGSEISLAQILCIPYERIFSYLIITHFSSQSFSITLVKNTSLLFLIRNLQLLRQNKNNTVSN